MKVKEAIEKKCFVVWLETNLIEENSTLAGLSFEKFTEAIWFFLCVIEIKMLGKLSTQLGLKNDKNIGNISLKIYELLGLTYTDKNNYLHLIY